jgi:hypothetical protein
MKAAHKRVLPHRGVAPILTGPEDLFQTFLDAADTTFKAS